MKLNPVAGFDMMLGVVVVIASFVPRRPQGGSPAASGPERWKGKIFLFFRLMGAVLIILGLLRQLGFYGTP